jgi:hypothetical protein
MPWRSRSKQRSEFARLGGVPVRPTEVNAKVAMHDHVAKPGEFAPWDLRFGGLDLVRQALA